MKLAIWTIAALLSFAQLGLGQTTRPSNPISVGAMAAAASTSSYAVLGATPREEALVRTHVQTMHPDVSPLRVVFVPHWKYVVCARTFRLHVPTGFTSAMFTHLPSRTIFIDADRYVSDDSLGYWLAHELGHLAANSPKENDAEKVAHEYRKRIRDARGVPIAPTRELMPSRR
jgi:hypothetical protein